MILSNGKKGEQFTIINIDTELKIKKRLQDMGLTQGIKIKIMSYYSNNAFILNVRGSRVVIGKDIAEKIHVEPSHCNNCSKKTRGNERHISHQSEHRTQHGA
jgi:ferrous iron transport protein A